MKQQIFIRSLILLILTSATQLSFVDAAKPAREYYQLTVYHYSSFEQEKVIEQYLEYAYVPALHRAGISKAGVLKAISNDTAVDKRIYLLIPLKNPGMITSLEQKLKSDAAFLKAGSEYSHSDYKQPPFNRKETILLYAFAMAPQMQVPELTAAKSERVYELRSYESATEQIFQSKVHMFNEGDEIGLFKRLNFNAVFYGEVIAGSKMPNLMYMTCFENKADRDAHWKAFGNDAQWKKLSSMPEYANNVSHIDIVFLRPVVYSDF